MRIPRLAPLLLACLLTAAALPAGNAQVSTTVAISNLLPSISDVAVAATVNPTAGTTTAVPVTVTVSDGNGYQDIAAVRVTVLAPDGLTVHVAQAPATSNADGSGVAATYAYSFDMQFHDDPAIGTSSYTIRAVAEDADGALSLAFLRTFHYSELAALSLDTSSLDFGELDPGARSSAETLTVTNHGNVRIDIDTSGTALDDGAGHAISVDHVKYDIGSSAFLTEKDLSGSTTTETGFNLDKGPSSSKATYWALETPTGEQQYIPSGSYSGTLALAAVQG